MRWDTNFVGEVAQHLQQLGLQSCPVCDSTELRVNPYPVALMEGGLPPQASNVPKEEDPYRGMAFAVRFECSTCGYFMLFNSERFRRGDEPTMTAEPM